MSQRTHINGIYVISLRLCLRASIISGSAFSRVITPRSVASSGYVSKRHRECRSHHLSERGWPFTSLKEHSPQNCPANLGVPMVIWA
jgi:hypothetical protein